jgi:hypothetical protein
MPVEAVLAIGTGIAPKSVLLTASVSTASSSCSAR